MPHRFLIVDSKNFLKILLCTAYLKLQCSVLQHLSFAEKYVKIRSFGYSFGPLIIAL